MSDGMCAHFDHLIKTHLQRIVLYLEVASCFCLLLSEAFSGPSNIQFTGQTTDSLRFRWNPAGGPVSGYVIQYVPLSGLGQPINAELHQVRPSVKGCVDV